MATLFISEHNAGASAGLPLVRWPALATQVVAIGGSSQQSAPFGGGSRIIRVHCDAVCSVFIGQDPIATTAHPRFAASQTEYLEINPGDQIAVIANT
jgi:hypothetical protein